MVVETDANMVDSSFLVGWAAAVAVAERQGRAFVGPQYPVPDSVAYLVRFLVGPFLNINCKNVLFNIILFNNIIYISLYLDSRSISVLIIQDIHLAVAVAVEEEVAVAFDAGVAAADIVAVAVWVPQYQLYRPLEADAGKEVQLLVPPCCS